MKIENRLFHILGLLILTSCISTQKVEHNIKLNQNALVSIGNHPPVSKKLGDTVEVKNEPILIQSPGYVSILLIPLLGSQSNTELNMKPIEKWNEGILNKKNAMSMDTILSAVNEIQTDLASGKHKAALIKIENLKRQYPHVTFLRFLEASTLVISGETTKALLVLDNALRDFPDNTAGLELYKNISGKAWNGSKKNQEKNMQGEEQ